MKLPIILSIGLVFFIACSKQKEKETGNDTTVVINNTITVTKDTILVETQAPVATPAPVILEMEHTNSIKVEKGDTIYTSTGQDIFVSDPYDFYLDANSIEELVGEKVKTEEKKFKEEMITMPIRIPLLKLEIQASVFTAIRVNTRHE